MKKLLHHNYKEVTQFKRSLLDWIEENLEYFLKNGIKYLSFHPAAGEQDIACFAWTIKPVITEARVVAGPEEDICKTMFFLLPVTTGHRKLIWEEGPRIFKLEPEIKQI
jgi:hypothetical protein